MLAATANSSKHVGRVGRLSGCSEKIQARPQVRRSHSRYLKCRVKRKRGSGADQVVDLAHQRGEGYRFDDELAAAPELHNCLAPARASLNRPLDYLAGEFIDGKDRSTRVRILAALPRRGAPD